MINLLLLDLQTILIFIYKKVPILATKAEWKAEQDKIIKSEAFDSSYFRGKSHFEDDGT